MGDRVVLVVYRGDGTVAAIEALDGSLPSDSSAVRAVSMQPGTVHIHPRRSDQWRPTRRPSGMRRLRRVGPDVRGGRMLAVSVLTLLATSVSSLAATIDRPEHRPAGGPVLGVVIDPVARVSSPVAVTAPVTPPPSPASSSVPANVAFVIAVDPTAPGYLPAPPASPQTIEECREEAAGRPVLVDGNYDRGLIAQMIHSAFECVARVAGLGERPPTSNRRWDGAEAWGFGSLAEQVAAEAVVVAYCESAGFRPRAIEGNNPWGYGGLFQMGGREMRRHGPAGGDKFDPVDNTVGAATYFLWGLERGHRWGGWGPWAVVNTDYDDPVNDRVSVPVLPRFGSTDPDHRGRTGPELPAWAVDPWAWTVPEWGGCPAMSGWRWPETEPLRSG